MPKLLMREVTVLQYTFRGGLRLGFHKKTRSKRIEAIPAPQTVTVPIIVLGLPVQCSVVESVSLSAGDHTEK